MLRAMHTPRFVVTSLGFGILGATLFCLTPALAKGKSTAKAQVQPKVEVKEPEPEPEPLAEPEPETETPPAEPEEGAKADKVSSPAPSPAADSGETWIRLPAVRKNTLWIDGGFRWDNGGFSRSEQVGGNRENNNDDISSLGPLFHFGYLWRANRNVAMGAVFGYGSSYDLNNDDLLIGQWLDLAYVADFSAPLSDKFSILGAPRAGVAVVLPGGILKERIDANQQAGYDTWSGPRYGFLLGFEAGVRYKLTPWLNLRATVGYTWNMLFLLDSKAQGQTVSASQTWQVQASRIGGAMGLELNF